MRLNYKKKKAGGRLQLNLIRFNLDLNEDVFRTRSLNASLIRMKSLKCRRAAALFIWSVSCNNNQRR